MYDSPKIQNKPSIKICSPARKIVHSQSAVQKTINKSPTISSFKGQRNRTKIICNACMQYVSECFFAIHSEKTCPGRKMHCSVCDVDFIGPTMFEEHLLKCKPTINCNFCGCTETLGTITEHLSKCTLRQVQCEHCNGLMCVKLVKDHMENSCPDRMIRCLQCSHFFVCSAGTRPS